MNFLTLGTPYFSRLVTDALSGGDHQVFNEEPDIGAMLCILNATSVQCVIIEIANKSKRTEAIVRELVRNRHGFVIVATAKESENFRRFALEAGVDVVLPSSIDIAELRLSLISAVRISASEMTDKVQIDGLTVDLRQQAARYMDLKIALSKREYQILEMLALSIGKPVTKTKLLDQIYGLDEAPALKIIDVFICKLRKKLAAAGWNVGHIKTYWGEGYSLERNSHGAAEEAA